MEKGGKGTAGKKEIWIILQIWIIFVPAKPGKGGPARPFPPPPAGCFAYLRRIPAAYQQPILLEAAGSSVVARCCPAVVRCRLVVVRWGPVVVRCRLVVGRWGPAVVRCCLVVGRWGPVVVRCCLVVGRCRPVVVRFCPVVAATSRLAGGRPGKVPLFSTIIKFNCFKKKHC